VGVVSAINRDFVPSKGVYYQGMIQTDAAINPGNSGGPLLNANGQVIGINSFIVTASKSSSGSIGIGFAIPINRAKNVVKEMLKFGQRRRIWTGLTMQDLNRAISQSLGYDRTSGVVVVQVDPGSAAEIAGIKPGDIIEILDHKYIQSSVDIGGFFLDHFVGEKVAVEYFRSGKRLKTTLPLLENPKTR
jgi:serine protease Do